MQTELVAQLEEARRRGDWRRVYATLEQLADTAGDPQTKAKWLRELATVAQQKFHNDRGAFDARRRLLELAPDDRESIAELARLAMVRREWATLAAAREAEAKLISDPGELLAILAELEVVYRTRLGDEKKAEEVAGRIRSLSATIGV